MRSRGPTPESVKFKISQSLKEWHANNPHPKGMKGKHFSEESKAKLSKSLKGRKATVEARLKMSKTKKGKKFSDEHKKKLSIAHKGISLSRKHKQMISEAHKRNGVRPPVLFAEDHPNWKGGTSFEPYCFRFNKRLKEETRNRDERKCKLCGKSELLEGSRLNVHHVDGNKMQGCDGNKWFLVSLCKSCHASVTHNYIREYELLSRINGMIIK